MNAPGKVGHKTIGLLADWFDERYQQTILETAEEATAQRALNLLAFGGGIPGSTMRESARRHRVFDAVGPQVVDGAILLAGTMVNELGPEALAALTRQIASVPCCTIGVELPGVPAVLVDNEAGIRQALMHLIDHHDCREVAFIRGPIRNKEAESRYQAYRSALEQADIPWSDALVYQGDFLQPSGEQAVRHWHAQGRVPAAIIAANDAMAIGALNALTALGVQVPSDVRLVGFDGTDAARHCHPPLTTVRQPLTELAVTAVRTVMDQVHGKEVAQTQQLQTHLVVRASCGCTNGLTSTGQSQMPDERPRHNNDGFSAEFSKRRPQLKAEFARIARGDFHDLPDWENTLLDAFAEQVTSDSEPFTLLLSRHLVKAAARGKGVSRYHDVLTAVRRAVMACAEPDSTERLRAENALHLGRVTVSKAKQSSMERRQADLEQFLTVLARAAAGIAGAFNFEELQEALDIHLPKLGVTACHVVVDLPFERTARRTNGEGKVGRLVAAYDAEGVSVTVPCDVSLEELAPSPVFASAKTHQFCVLPLFHRDCQLGYCLIEHRNAQIGLSEILREQLSIALYGALVVQST